MPVIMRNQLEKNVADMEVLAGLLLRTEQSITSNQEEIKSEIRSIEDFVNTRVEVIEARVEEVKHEPLG